MSRLFTFIGGNDGPWRVTSSRAIVGDALPAANRVRVVAGHESANGSAWTLSGLTSNERYVTRPEKTSLVAISRPRATGSHVRGADSHLQERRVVGDDAGRAAPDIRGNLGHIRIGMDYLPAVARRLHHCRDLGWPEPFDFLTWFEFAPADAPAFDICWRGCAHAGVAVREPGDGDPARAG